MGSEGNLGGGSVVNRIQHNYDSTTHTLTSHPVDATDDRTPGERLADRVVEGIGTWKFLIIQTLAIGGWITLRVSGVPIDNPQLTILNLCLSIQAGMTGPLLLLANNRKSVRDRQMASHDFLVNQEALRRIIDLHEGKAPPTK